MASKHWTECNNCKATEVSSGSEEKNWFGAFGVGPSITDDLDFCSWDCMRTFMV